MNLLEKLIYKKKIIPLDKFIDIALYDKQLGYYENKKIFSRDGDFITSPFISSIFSEMISIWIVSYWIYLKKPKKINILELGPGNGLMINQIINSLKKIKTFDANFNIYLHEKSESLIKVQKENLNNFKNIVWIKNINKIKQYPTIIIANEFFDAFPIKQFFKINNNWHEQCISFKKNIKKIIYYKNKVNNNILKKYSKFFNINKSKIIEYPVKIENYLNSISKIIKKNNGIFLTFDYGYSDIVGKNTLRAIKKHKIVDLLKEYTDCDITFDINFNILKNIFKKNNVRFIGAVSQNFFLQKLGIMERASQIVKKQNVIDSKNLILSINKLINPKEMGNTFKALAFCNKNCKFNLGFI
jgi:NADH dehydrogenase [ubiquinone] 1 alpha subcomplex assembly factor 7